jgi:RNA polymerase sigma factor (sigma-70 family)
MSALTTPIDPLQWLPLARWIAWRYWRRHGAHSYLDVEDLVQEGAAVLVEATRGYDGRAEFRAYAARAIRNRLWDALDDARGPVRVPHATRHLARRVGAGALDPRSLTAERRACLAAARQIDEGAWDGHTGGTNDGPDPLEVAEAVEALGTLRARERDAVRAHLGLDGDPLSLREIGRRGGVSYPVARKYYERGIATLRARLGAEDVA